VGECSHVAQRVVQASRGELNRNFFGWSFGSHLVAPTLRRAANFTSWNKCLSSGIIFGVSPMSGFRQVFRTSTGKAFPFCAPRALPALCVLFGSLFPSAFLWPRPSDEGARALPGASSQDNLRSLWFSAERGREKDGGGGVSCLVPVTVKMMIRTDISFVSVLFWEM
jgi:hypothetical protein